MNPQRIARVFRKYANELDPKGVSASEQRLAREVRRLRGKLARADNVAAAETNGLRGRVRDLEAKHDHVNRLYSELLRDVLKHVRSRLGKPDLEGVLLYHGISLDDPPTGSPAAERAAEFERVLGPHIPLPVPTDSKRRK